MARTSQVDAHPGTTPPVQQAGVWLQYKGTRARTMQTAKNINVQAGLRSTIIDGFLADLEALQLTLPGLPMVNIRIVWGTGQIRADYSLKREGLRFNVVIRYLVKRASTEFLDRMSERSIARLLYIEDGSHVEIHKLSLGRLPSLPLPKPHHTPPLTSLPDKVLNIPSSSQPPTAYSSATSSHDNSSSQSSSSPYVRPSPDRFQTSSSVQRIPSVAMGSQSRQASPLKSHQAPPSSISHPGESSPHFIVAQPHSSDEEGIGRDPRCSVGLGATNQIAEPSIALGPHALSYEALASSTIPSATPDDTQSSRRLIVSQVSLTSDACSRLQDPTDEAVLATLPVVRVLVLHSIGSLDGGATTTFYEAFVTDGRHYMWLSFAQSATRSFADRDDRKSLQVGSAVRLMRMSRISPSANLCTILVHDIEIIIDGTSDIRYAATNHNQPPNTAIRSEGLSFEPPRPQAFDNCPPCGTLIHHERAALLLADAKFQEERRRRRLLEHALEDVCEDLHRLQTLYAAAAEVLRKIDRLTEAAVISD